MPNLRPESSSAGSYLGKQVFYQLALTFVPGIGSRLARHLLARFGDAESIFKASLKELITTEGISRNKAIKFNDSEILKRAEKELDYLLKNDIQCLFIGSKDYPTRLLNCEDAPILVYYKGSANLNTDKIISVVGTRRNTEYGQRLTEDLITGLQSIPDLLVVSGLALGIDTIAHKAALRSGLPTVGVLGHGLDRIYPFSNEPLSQEMLQNGGLLTEFPFGTRPDRQNFPVRNRIVAGLSDLIIVIESNIKGGAMITAFIGASYHREIAAFPGRIYDSRSEGVNHLIQTNIASLVTSAADVAGLMGWQPNNAKGTQKKLFHDILPEEKKILDILSEKDSVHADDLLYHLSCTTVKLAALLLQMEMKGFIKALPGKHYRCN